MFLSKAGQTIVDTALRGRLKNEKIETTAKNLVHNIKTVFNEVILEKDIEAKKAEYEAQRKVLETKLKLATEKCNVKETMLEAAKARLQTENLDNLLDFIEGNDVKKVIKKKKKSKMVHM